MWENVPSFGILGWLAGHYWDDFDKPEYKTLGTPRLGACRQSPDYDVMAMCVKFIDSVDYQGGHVVCWDDPTVYEVSNDRSGTTDNLPAGVVFFHEGDADNAPEEDDYGLIQVRGNAKVRAANATYAFGDWVSTTTTDGFVGAGADDDENRVGWCIEAKTTTNASPRLLVRLAMRTG